MKQEHSELIDSLLQPDAASCPASLIAALRARRTRRKVQRGITAGIILGGTVAVVAALLSHQRAVPPNNTTLPEFAANATEPENSRSAPPTELTTSELLDTFGSRPVALVSWPDGRRQLLTIRPPSRPQRPAAPAGRRRSL